MIERNICLAYNAKEYNSVFRRPKADPLGLSGLPTKRDDLNYMVLRLCQYLINAGKTGIGGKGLARLLFDSTDTRTVRHLVAYARVHKHRHEIIGLPGSGYAWGPAAPELYQRSIGDNEQRARDHFFIAALLKRQGVAMGAVQMIFDFMGHNVPADRRRDDNLAAMFAAEGTSVSDFLDAFVTELAKTEDGKRVLADAGRKHAAYLLTGEAFEQLRVEVRSIGDAATKALQSIDAAAPAA